MVSFPILAPGSEWWADFFKGIRNGDTTREAVMSANSRLSSPKYFGRYAVKNPSGQMSMLSLAVEGGGRQLRSFSGVESLNLSEHGDWRNNHLGALETALGRKPFFRHVESSLKDVYLNTNINTLKDFNTAIFKLIYTFLIGNIQPCQILSFTPESPVWRRGREVVRHIDPEVSALQTISELGKEALLGFLCLATAEEDIRVLEESD